MEVFAASRPDAGMLEVVRASPTCAFGAFQGVLIANWRTEVRLSDVKGVVALRNRMMAHDFLGAVHIAEPGLPLPTEECRTEARVGLESRKGNPSPVALAILGTGFGASAIRSVGTAIFALRSGMPTRIFSSSEDAARWLCEALADRVEAHALAEACTQLRSASQG